MARYDKYEPYAGGFRAPLAADFGTGGNGADLGKIWAVALDVNGKVVKVGTSSTTIADLVGVLILTQEKYAGDIVDVMTDGEIADIAQVTPWDNLGLAPAAGKAVYAVASTGAFNQTATANLQVGFFVEPARMVVRVGLTGTVGA